MERLVTWTQHGPKIKGFCMVEHDFDLTECRILGDVARRLAAYEDSGLSPEEVQKLKKSDASKEQCTIDQHGEIHRLRDELKRYKQAEQEGRLVELPPDGQIYHIERIEKTGETWVGNKPCRYITADGYYCGWGLAAICFPFSELGKTVFLTREEAEKALGRCSHEHNHQRRKITP